MRITKLWASNFRALTGVKVRKTHDINVIVGPNAIGKSTLLEAIRLPKAILAPRFPNEAHQTLVNVGALSPHFQLIGANMIDFAALANNPAREIAIGFSVVLAEDERHFLNSATEPLALTLLQNETGNNVDGNLALAQILSSQAGVNRLTELKNKVASRLSGLTESTEIEIELTLDPQSGRILGKDEINQAFLAIIERNQTPNKTKFSFFPADRVLPQGEQPIQLGSADAQQQLFSHMATPALKYARIKQTIVQSMLLGTNSYNVVEEKVNLILEHLLPGKSFGGIDISPIGALKIFILDRRSGRKFDIDFMSSGEKGLLMTFLFIMLNVTKNGVILLDEPELHLNGAVQEKLLAFIYEQCVKALNAQVFLCTHSPEIVKESIGKEYCALLHLRSGSDLTPVFGGDQVEILDIFDRLGHSAADVLFTKGDVYLEGESDVSIIKAGFDELVDGFKLSATGSRTIAEREVPLLQEQENKGYLRKLQIFLIDNDGKPTNLKSTPLVRITQLDKRNIENYLIEDDFLFDLVAQNAESSVPSRGSFPDKIEELAMRQIEELAIRETFEAMCPKSIGLKRGDLKGKSSDEVAEAVLPKIIELRAELDRFSEIVWKDTFISNCVSRKQSLAREWKHSWRDKCDGKLLIDDIYREYGIKMKKNEFKKAIISRMAQGKTEKWRLLRDILSEVVSEGG